MMTEYHYNAQVQTYLKTFTYDFNRKLAHLVVPELCSTDMGGCIGYFQAIDPDVARIDVHQEDVLDIVYYKTETGWHAENHR